jgi:hypothetical protein
MKRQFKKTGHEARDRRVRAAKILPKIAIPKIRRPAVDAVAYAAVLEVIG